MNRSYLPGFVALALLVTGAFTLTGVRGTDEAGEKAMQANVEVSADKVPVCHMTGRVSDGNVLNPKGQPIPAGEAVGRVIWIADVAVAQHCAHGDKVITGSTPQRHGNCRVAMNPGSGCALYQ